MTKKPTIAELLERIRALEEALKKANAEIARLKGEPRILSSNPYSCM
jgi:uncharacterized protein YhaN